MLLQKYTPDENNGRLNNIHSSKYLSLEPRLQEYMKKRQYFKDNNIIPTIPLEKEFSITSVDKKILQQYLNGNTNIYKPKQYEKTISQKQKEQHFPSTYFKEDPRVLKPNKTNQDTPINRGMFAPDKKSRYYDEPPTPMNNDKITDSRDFTETKFKKFKGDVNELKFNPRIDPKINPGFEEFDKCDSPFRVTNEKCKPYNKDLKSNYNDYNNDPHQDYLNLDLIDDYITNKSQNRTSKTSHSPTSIYDRNMETIGRKPSNKLSFTRQKMNTQIESDLMRGMPITRPRNRSYGYRDTFENHFDYIDDDFQNPDNTDIWVRGGEPTRLDNKLLAKNRTYVREIM